MGQQNLEIFPNFIKSIKLYISKIDIFLPLGVAMALLYSIVQFYVLRAIKDPSAAFTWMAILNKIFMSLPQMTVIFCAFQLLSKKDTTVKEGLARTIPLLGMYIMVSVLVEFVIGSFSGIAVLYRDSIGFIFIVPAVYFGTIWAFADIIVVLQRRAFNESFKLSVELVREFFWPVFFYNILLGGVVFLPLYFLRNSQMAIAFYFSFAIPFYLVGRVVLFDQLRMIKTWPAEIVEEFKEDDDEKN